MTLGPFQASSRKPCIPSTTGGVQRFKDVESAAKRKGPRPAGGVQYRDSGVAPVSISVEGMPEGAQQLRPFALDDDVHGKLLGIQVQGDEVVYFRDLALPPACLGFPDSAGAGPPPHAKSRWAGRILQGLAGSSLTAGQRRPGRRQCPPAVPVPLPAALGQPQGE